MLSGNPSNFDPQRFLPAKHLGVDPSHGILICTIEATEDIVLRMTYWLILEA